MYKYDVEWFVNDDGAQVRRLILHLQENVDIADVRPECFSVFVNRKDESGMTMHIRTGNTREEKTQGYRKILSAYPSDKAGEPRRYSDYITLELDMADRQARALIGTDNGHKFVTCEYCIMQIAPIGEVCGMIFDELNQIQCPQTERWLHARSAYEPMPLQYGYYQPEETGKHPLIIWLHGAGEGGKDPRVAYMGNNVVSLSSEKVQKYFGGAWVLAPQSPTMWMDDGSHSYGHTGKSIYGVSLKALIDEFVELHAVDRNRIYIGGCSNGGFMTMRMIIDYPGYFAAGYPMCEALYDDLITDEQIKILKDTPIWFLHATSDDVVNPEETSVATYHRLVKAGAENIHMTYIDDRLMINRIGHWCWVPGLKEEFNMDFNGEPVFVNGHPVTRFQWLAAQSK